MASGREIIALVNISVKFDELLFSVQFFFIRYAKANNILKHTECVIYWQQNEFFVEKALILTKVKITKI